MSEGLRRVPWSGEDGRAVFVVADPDAPGSVSRRADTVESVQLEMAGVLLAHARQLVDEAGPAGLRHLATELTRALADTLRIASRVKP
ncbi:hypothetical protein IAG42_14930 [Streptomyces xanthii]|uniref:Uncharacterized protein n=1 Tax=Streptomyces xanthii TaxID=2768069 RepID=A0A7H1B7S7_9ACTN|nr:hypothetical protein IAG42_14930 [Streptomyces xanthii]